MDNIVLALGTLPAESELRVAGQYNIIARSLGLTGVPVQQAYVTRVTGERIH